ncbi:MAG: hypothetical protein LBE49_03850 [Deltaproteobacteria bacterium]|jgi:hypothetical protein|nr:hypothetical protein [Deltaproteobacteria bacterium]
MIKHFYSLLLAVAAIALLASAAMAQEGPITAQDVDFYIKILGADPTEQAKVLEESGLTPERYAAVMFKINMFTQLESQPLDEATKKSMMEANPSYAFSPDELKLLQSRKAELIDAFAKFTAPK